MTKTKQAAAAGAPVTGAGWRQNARNSVLEAEGFYISWSAQALLSDSASSETALVVPNLARLFGRDFFILNGDHRAAYEALAPKGLAACLGYFREHEAEASSWSDVLESLQ